MSKNLLHLKESTEIKMTSTVNFKIIVFPQKLLKHALTCIMGHVILMHKNCHGGGLRSTSSIYDIALLVH